MSETLYAFRRNLVVAASAGTGKTHALVGVVVHLLLGASELGGAPRDPIDPARVVATTFSRKAAAEIRARVVEALERLASGEATAPYRADLAAARARAALEPWTDRAVADRARRALERVGRAQIGTLHGFAATIARRHAIELGLSPSFDLEEESETVARERASIERVLAARFDARDPWVRAFVGATSGVEGLVDVIARTLDRLKEDGRRASELDVASDDGIQVASRVGDVVVAARALAGDAKLGAPARAVAAAYDADAPFDDALAELFGARRSAKGSPALVALLDLRDALPKAANNPAKARALGRLYRARDSFGEQASAARALLADCEAAIRVDARRASALGFGDVLRAARDVLRDSPEAAAALGEQLDVLLVDEFQDTSRLQRELVELVWERDPRTRAPGTSAHISNVRGEGLFVVGDRKQSIYAFRGADVGVFAALCVGLAGVAARDALGIAPGAAYEPETPRADFVSLRHNRRSTEAILDFANAFSAHRLQPALSPAELYEIAYAPATEDLLVPPERAGGERGATPTWLRVAVTGERANGSSRIDEAYAIAERVQRVVAEGEGTRWRDCAVLAQSNAMLDATAFALAQAGVPYVVAGAGFHAAREVRDVLALLAVVVHDRDALALLSVLRGPWAGVHDDTLIALTDPQRGLADPSEWEHGERRARVRPEDRATVARVRDVVLRLRAHADELGAAATLREAVRALELEEVLVQLPRGAQRVANVRKLLRLAERATSPRGFLDAMRTAAEREVREVEAATFSDEDDAVRLLTVHASKGLAFPVVFVPQVGDGARAGDRLAFALEVRGEEVPRIAVRLPSDAGDWLTPPSYERALTVAARRDRAERARLAYVAVTRAERALYLVGDRRVPRGGATDAYAATNAAALADLATVDGALVSVEPTTPVPPKRALVADGAAGTPEAPRAPRPLLGSLPIAPGDLVDFAKCPRRFQLARVLGVPEPAARAAAIEVGADPALAAALVDARWTGRFPRVALDRCDALGCGYVALCHPSR